MELEEKTRKWLVIGICLQTVISPVLRKFIEPVFESLYQSLVASKGIDVQTYQNRLEWFGTNKRYLNYEGINNNRPNHRRDYKQYDYKVTNQVDLSKLFIETNISQYTGFDESCDSSALLNIIIYTDVPGFSPGLRCVAEKVRSIRNAWAHPAIWDYIKFVDEMTLMANLIKQMALPGTEENKTLEELDRWAQQGVEMIGGFSGLDLVRELSKGIEKIENPDVQKVKTDLSKIQEKIITLERKMEDLEDSQTDIKKRVKTVEKGLQKERDRVLPDYQMNFIEDWRKDEGTFLETKAANTVGERIETQNIVVVTGSSGSGKSSIVHHIAFELQRTEKYDIIPVLEGPTDIIKHFHREKKQVFVVDDVCGKEGICKPMVDLWLTHMEKLTKIFTNSCSAKLLVSCRLQIFHENFFQCLVMFKDTECNLLSKDLRLSSTERKQMLAKYVKEDWINDIDETMLNVDFLPLLCKLASNEKSKNGMINLLKHPVECISENIDYIVKSNSVKQCVLVLCVLFEAGFDIKWLKTNNKSIDICKNLGFDVSIESVRNIVKENFRVFTGTYVKKIGTKYYIIHDMIYNIVVVKCGQTLPETFIKHAPVNIIANYFSFSDIQLSHTNFVIELSDDYFETYFDRILEDIESGKSLSMLYNTQMTSHVYRNRLIKYLTERQQKFENLLKTLSFCRKPKFELIGGHWCSSVKIMMTSTFLTEAMSTGYTDIVQVLLNSGCNVNGTIPYEKPLLWAIYYGHNDMVKLLLKNNANVSQYDSFNSEPLTVACHVKNKEAVTMLLEQNVGLLTHCDEFGWTSLFFACSSTNVEIVKLLLEYNADVTHCDNNGQIALYTACRSGNVEILKHLLEHNADLTHCDNNGQTVLYAACKSGNVEILKLLLEHYADVTHCDNNGQTVLYAACRSGNVEILKLLLEHNADVTHCDKDGQTPLYAACKTGNVEIVKLLLENKANVAHCDKDGQTPLYAACKTENIEIVKLLLEYKADVTHCDKDGQTPLYAACKTGNVEIVKLLLEYNADVAHCDKDGRTPLFAACHTGDENMVGLLLLHNADMSVSDKYGRTPLYAACSSGRLKVTRLLLKYNADITHCDKYGQTPLYHACLSGNLEVVKLLLEYNAAVTHCDKYGQTPLYYAYFSGNLEVVKFLLEYSSAVTHCDKYGRNPLRYTCLSGNVKLARLLLEHNADATHCDKDGRTLLHGACVSGNVEVLNLLLEQNADLAHCDKNGQTPLHAACKTGNVEIVKLLLEQKADVTHCDKVGQTPLYAACKSKNVELVKHLIENKADVTHCDKDGETPLHIACKTGDVDVNRCLLEYKADVTHCDNDGQTPLYVACKSRDVETVKLLLEYKADITHCDKDGQTPLHIACKTGDVDVIRLLLEHKADVTHCDKDGQTPLYAVCMNNHFRNKEVVNLLLKHKADVTHCDKDGQTPLHKACKTGDIEVIRLLLQHKADVTHCDKDGQTPLYGACMSIRFRNKEVVKLLLKHNADVTHCDKDGHSVFFMTCKRGRLEIAKLLLQYITDVTKADTFGKSPLEYVQDMGYPMMVHLVCNHKSVKKKYQDITVIYDRTV